MQFSYRIIVIKYIIIMHDIKYRENRDEFNNGNRYRY